MRSDEAEYWRGRALQEKLAAQNAACAVARRRHYELASMCRLRALLTSDPEPRLEENRKMATADAG